MSSNMIKNLIKYRCEKSIFPYTCDYPFPLSNKSIKLIKCRDIYFKKELITAANNLNNNKDDNINKDDNNNIINGNIYNVISKESKASKESAQELYEKQKNFYRDNYVLRNNYELLESMLK